MVNPRCRYAQPLSLGRVETKSVSPHPDPNRLQATGHHGEGITGLVWGGKKKLGIISILMIPHPKTTNDLTQRLHIDVEQEGRENRPLRNSTNKRPRGGSLPSSQHRLRATQEIGGEPP
jgi:hypothetical protein